MVPLLCCEWRGNWLWLDCVVYFFWLAGSLEQFQNLLLSIFVHAPFCAFVILLSLIPVLSCDHSFVHLLPHLIDRLSIKASSCNHQIARQSSSCSQGIFDSYAVSLVQTSAFRKAITYCHRSNQNPRPSKLLHKGRLVLEHLSSVPDGLLVSLAPGISMLFLPLNLMYSHKAISSDRNKQLNT